jgi:hypothetical protein
MDVTIRHLLQQGSIFAYRRASDTALASQKRPTHSCQMQTAQDVASPDQAAAELLPAGQLTWFAD